MKIIEQYIIDNITPLAIGFAVGVSYSYLLNTIENIICKIALIINK